MYNLNKYQDISFYDPEKIKKIQENLFAKHVIYCKKNSPYYKKLFKNIDLKKIKLEQISDLPFTEKNNIEKNNDDFCAVDYSKIIDIVLSSGTTGKPIKMMYTDFDLQRLAYNEEKSFLGCGITSKDTVLLTCTMDRCFIAGLAYFLGIRNIGAAAIRNGLNSIESHFEIIKRMNPTVIVGVPSFLKNLGIYVNEKRIKKSVIRLVCIGEPLRDKNLKLLNIANDLQCLWGAKVFSTYASSEIVTTFCECSAQEGGHLHPDLAIVEIVDDKYNVLPYGETGEIVVTPLSVEGMPLVRFKTGDISFLFDNPCKCGRKSNRLGPILGRKKQMMKVKGTTLYPQIIFSALDEIENINDYFVSVTSESELSDKIEIHITLKNNSQTVDALQNKLQSKLRVKPDIIISDDVTIKNQIFQPQSRKPIRFFDRRKI